MNDELLDRLDSAEQRIRELQAEVDQLRVLALQADEPEAAVAEPGGWWQDERGRWHEGPSVEPPRVEAPAEPLKEVEREEVAPARERLEREPSIWQREVSLPEVQLDDLLGTKGLAWTGGVVTLLGVVFFFVLAANRGWIGPGLRVALGAAASCLVFGAGVWAKRRFGSLYAAYSAAGAGLAGGYATLLAATALYDFLPQWAALLVAAGIAAAGLALALLWESETIASIGLIGAMAVPATLVFQGGLTTIGTAFAALVFAAAAAVALREDWRMLLGAAFFVSLLQVAGLAAYDDSVLAGGVIAVAAALWLLYLGTGVAWQLVRGEEERLDRIATSVTLLGTSYGVLVAVRLLEGSWGRVDREGAAIGAIALVEAALAGTFWRTRRRELTALHGGIALAVAAISAADLLSGANLTYVWAAEAALLAWLAPRARERAFQLASFAYLALAAVHALAFEARVDRLFEDGHHPGRAVPSAAAVALAALASAWFARPFDEPVEHHGLLRRALDELDRSQDELRAVATAVAGLAGVYALSLGLLALVRLGASFEVGHVAVTTAWALVGLGVALVGLRRRSDGVLLAGGVWFAATVTKAIVFDGHELSENLRSASYLAVAGCLLLAGYLVQLLDERRVRLTPPVLAAAIVPLGLAVSAVGALVDGHYGRVDLQGLALLGVAVVYVALGALAFVRDRDLSSVMWALGLVVAVGAESELVSGFWLALAWAGSAAVLALLSDRLGESRLLAAAGVYLLLAVAYALGMEAPPDHLVHANAHPGRGIASVAAAAAAAAVFARFCTDGSYAPNEPAHGYGALARALDARRADGRLYSAWGAGVLAVYALSLGILELYEKLAPGSVDTNFQRGHTNVSALWGLLGLALLYVGLRRDLRALRLGGFALFGVSLGKIFAYDLPNLSAVTRALSFLAVGAVLLMGAFFYQRLKTQLTERH